MALRANGPGAVKMRRPIELVAFAVFLLGISSKQANARKPYFDEFREKYADQGADYVQLIDETKCAICHKGKSKNERNSYGIALSKVIAKNEKVKANINQALGKIENEKSPSGETFIELLRRGKLPGANGQDAKNHATPPSVGSD
jgi:hypothetical protein